MYNVFDILNDEQKACAKKVTMQLFDEAHSRVVLAEKQLVRIMIGIEPNTTEALRLYKMKAFDNQCLKEIRAYIRKVYPEEYETIVKPTLKRRIINIDTLH